MKYQLYFACILVFLTVISCSESKFEDNDNFSDGKEYVVLEKGKYRTFQYDTIAYSGTARDTFSGFAKYEIGDSFINNSGDITYELKVYNKKKESDKFALVRMETIRIQDNKLIESHNGLNFIKLVFPVTDGSRWLGNGLFNNSNEITEEIAGDKVVTIKAGVDWRYQITGFREPISSGEFSFENGLIVNHINDTTSIDLRNMTEYFAEGIGMVKKEATILTKRSTTQNPIVEDAENGYIMKFDLIDYN